MGGLSGSVYAGGVPPWIARFFHRFPHVNVTGGKVNSTWDWRSEAYVESLGVLGAFPALLLIFFLLMLLLYLLTRCCDRNAKRDRPLLCLKVLLFLLSLTTCAAIGLGLYGNDDFHNGVETFVASLKNMHGYFDVVKNQTLEAQSSIESRVYPLMSDLGRVFERPLSNNTAHLELLAQMTYMEQNITSTLDNARSLGQYFDGPMNVSPHETIQLIESIRWPTTLALLIIFVIFCVILDYAIVRHSRCCFITFSVLGLIAVILNWSLVSLYLVGSVALADICVNPNRAAITELSKADIRRDIAEFYLNCQTHKPEVDPFKEVVQEGQKSCEGAQQTLRVINSIATVEYSNAVDDYVDGLFKELYKVESLLGETSMRAECQPIHGFWVKGVEGLCSTSLFGLALLLLSALASALLFTLLVGFDSHTWIYIQRRKRYLQKEECVAFLPSTYEGGHAHGTGSTGRGGRRSGGAGSRNGTMPPGGYHRGESSLGHSFAGPNHGQYATLSKQCKTLEANDFY